MQQLLFGNILGSMTITPHADAPGIWALPLFPDLFPLKTSENPEPGGSRKQVTGNNGSSS